jgi:hypothetical protein
LYGVSNPFTECQIARFKRSAGAESGSELLPSALVR